MTGEHKLPLGVSVATMISAAIAVGVLWNKVDVLADDHVTQESVDNIKDDVEEIKESLDKHIDKQAEKNEQQQALLIQILQSVENDP